MRTATSDLPDVLYLDTSPLVKLIVAEPESSDLASWLDARPETPLCTSVIGRVELIRAARRRGAETVPAAMRLLSEIALIPLDSLLLDLAASLEPVGLRTIDAIHLASATSLADSLDTVVTYNDRLLSAAGLLQLTTASPGRTEQA